MTGDPSSLDRDLAVLVSFEDCVWYRAGWGSLKPTGKTRPEREVLDRLREVKGQIERSKSRVRSERYEQADENDLTRLRDGDQIEVQFRSGSWLPATFAGFVPGSGNVRFVWAGRTKTCSPKFVRRAI